MEKQLSIATQKRLKTNYGSWALVTGATSGIGKAITLQLAEAGFHVFVVSRKVEALEQLTSQLETDYGINTNYLAVDLSQSSSYPMVIEATSDFDIGMVVLSAGYGTSGSFINSKLESEVNMLDVNCRAVLVLSHYFAQKFSKINKGAIVLLSSIVAFQGVPNAAHYAATKAYVQTLGEGLAGELKNSNVSLLIAAPGPVATSFSERANLQMGKALTPDEIAVPILKAIGKKTVLFPGSLTKLLLFGLRTVPRWGKVKIMGMVMGGMTKHQKEYAKI